MKQSNHSSYYLISDDAVSDDFTSPAEEKAEDNLIVTGNRRRKSHWAVTVTLINFVFFAASCTLLLICWPYLGRNGSLKETSYFCKPPINRSADLRYLKFPINIRLLILIDGPKAPVLEKLNIPLIDKQFDGRLFNPNEGEPPIFLQDPSPDVDAAWMSLTDPYPVLAISGNDLRRLKKDPVTAVRIPEDMGFGNDAYFGRLDVFHQLHCLNAVRKAAYYDHYHPGEPRSAVFKPHINHCIHMMLQNILCTASTDIVTFQFRENQEGVYSDFDMNHKCRDFKAIKEWAVENAVADKTSFSGVKRPPNYKHLLLPDHLWSLLNRTRPVPALGDEYHFGYN